ncbi:MAG: histone deacetylase [Planctomycetota bacterium]
MSRSHRFIVALGLATLMGCASPQMLATKTPRAGMPVGEKMAVVFSSKYDISFGGIERLYHFDIHKYANIYARLVQDGLIQPEEVFVPAEVSREDLLLVHSEDYLARLCQPMWVAKYLEFGPVALMPAGMVDDILLRAFRYATNGTILASRLALKYGMAINLGGGYHHAQPDKGGGFCIYADVAIAIRRLQKDGRIKRALLVDLDAHQGNGNAICFQDDEDVYTFSIHEENNYPIPKAMSDFDIGTDAGVDDAMYLQVLREHLPRIIENARPDIIYLLAGTDVYEGDRLGHFEMTRDGIIRRDMYVFDQAAERGIPIVMVLSGGYSKASWWLHCGSIREILIKYGKRTPTKKVK